MKRVFFFLTLLCFSEILFSQGLSDYNNQWSYEVVAGTTSFQGDLVEGNGPYKRMNPCLGVNLKYRLPNMTDIEKFEIRAGLAYGRLAGSDAKNNDPELRERNLSFKSHLIEFNLGCEYTILDITSDEGGLISPYVFAGVGLFHFNPYTFDNQGNKTFLRPLCTEGQGLSEYPGRKKYSLTQFEIPMAIGVKVDVGAYVPALDGWFFSYEFMYHQTFTDYIDDVSKSYASLDLLKSNYGPKSAELSFRQINVPFSKRENERRGNPGNRDLFFYNTFKMATTLNWGAISLRDIFSGF